MGWQETLFAQVRPKEGNGGAELGHRGFPRSHGLRTRAVPKGCDAGRAAGMIYTGGHEAL